MKTEGSRTRKEMKKVESMKEKRETQKEQIPPELVAKAKAGDQAAFSELYQQTSTVLYRSIRSMVHDEDLAWDILQDSYFRAYKSLDQLENNAAFLSWLRRISVNVTATQMSKRLPTPFSSLSGEDSEQPELPDLSVDTQPELALDKKETSRLVQEILAELSEEQHLIIGMRYYEELSVKEISELLRIAPGTVRAQLFRGRKRVETAVRALEKKGVKLYGLSPLPFFLTLLRQTEPAKDAVRAARKAVLAKTAAAGGQTVTLTAKAVGGSFLHTALGKGAAVLLAAALAVGGWFGYRALRDSVQPRIGDYRPTDSLADTEALPVSSTEPVSVISDPSFVGTGSAEIPSDLDLLLGETIVGKSSYIAENGEERVYYDSIPCILADTPGAQEINEEIERALGKSSHIELPAAEAGLSAEIQCISYSARFWGDVISLCICSSGYPNYEYLCFFYDASAGRRLTVTELLERRGISREAYLSACREKLEASVQDWNEPEELIEEFRNRLQSDAYLLDLPVYINEFGEVLLCEPHSFFFETLDFGAAESTAPIEMAENEAFASLSGTHADGVLGVIVNDACLDSAPAPTVVWNEGASDRLLICPRYAGSVVSVWKIAQMEGRDRQAYRLDGPDYAPVYSAVCAQGDCFAACLDRPAGEARWFVSIKTPSGAKAGLCLENSESGGPLAYEYLSEDSMQSLYRFFAYDSDQSPSSYVEYLKDFQAVFPAEKLLAFLRAAQRKNVPAWEAMQKYCAALSQASEGDSAAWTIWESSREGALCTVRAARIHEHYCPGNFSASVEDYLADREKYRNLSVEERVRLQAEYYAMDDNRNFFIRPSEENADSWEPLYFTLSGITVCNPTLLAQEVEVRVDGTLLGSFPLTEDDFCTLIDLDPGNLPGDVPVQIELRVVKSRGPEGAAVTELWCGCIGGNLSGAR